MPTWRTRSCMQWVDLNNRMPLYRWMPPRSLTLQANLGAVSAQVAQRQRRQQCAAVAGSTHRHCVQLQPGEVRQTGQRLQAALGQLPILQ